MCVGVAEVEEGPKGAAEVEGVDRVEDVVEDADSPARGEGDFQYCLHLNFVVWKGRKIIQR